MIMEWPASLARLHGTVYAGAMEYQKARRGQRTGTGAWDAARLQALRRHLGYTQQQLADEMGMRQQTVSEWETSVYQPRGASARLLSLIAERANFSYKPDLSPLPDDEGGDRAP
jgi:DNA-binding transcriptional regulator YiaG